jgi:hypothetical protein
MTRRKLQLSTYRPNYNDPRVRRRVEAVLDWASSLLVDKRPRPVASSTLTKLFGNQTSNQLSTFLRANLLQPVDSHAVGMRATTYTIRRAGYDKLCAALNLSPMDEESIAKKVYGGIADGTTTITYSEGRPGQRRYHPVQNLRRQLRAKVFAGWYDYDVEACAPTLVLQYVSRVSSKAFPTLRRLVEDKAALRSHVQTLTGRPMGDVKKVVNGLFFGAKLMASDRTSVFKALGADKTALKAVKGDVVVQDLVTEAKAMWDLALQVDGGLLGGQGTEGERRMAIYQSLERSVIDCMETVMVKAGIKYVLMHDGFMANRRIQVEDLTKAALAGTGFKVRLSEVRIGEAG